MIDEGIRFQRLQTPRLSAPWLTGRGEIEYALELGSDGRAYIVLLKSTGTGRLSRNRFELSRVIKNLDDGLSKVESTDGLISGPDTNGNSKSFVEAVVNQLLRRSHPETK